MHMRPCVYTIQQTVQIFISLCINPWTMGRKLFSKLDSISPTYCVRDLFVSRCCWRNVSECATISRNKPLQPPHPSSWRVGASHGLRSFVGIVQTATVYCSRTQGVCTHTRTYAHRHTSTKIETNYISWTSAGLPQTCFTLAFLGALPCPLNICYDINYKRYSLTLKHSD